MIMKSNSKYLIIKEKKKFKKLKLENKKIDGYILIKEHKKIINDVSVNKVMVVNKNLIEKSINKKLERKFKKLLELIASICEDDDNPQGMIRALSEIEKFRRIVFNEFIMYMNKIQLEKMSQKIKVIEHEIKVRLYEYNKNMYKEEVVVEEKSSRRSR